MVRFVHFGRRLQAPQGSVLAVFARAGSGSEAFSGAGAVGTVGDYIAGRCHWRVGALGVDVAAPPALGDLFGLDVCDNLCVAGSLAAEAVRLL